MKIVILEDLALRNEEIKMYYDEMVKAGHDVDFYESTENEHELKVRIKDADIIVESNIPLPKNVLESAENLKLISVAFTGVDHIDMDYCRKNNIVVKNCPRYSIDSVAELTFLLILGIYRKIIKGDNAVRIQRTRHKLIGTELRGKTIGIVGTGKIGLRVAELAKAFKCKVIAYSKSEKEEAKKMGIEYVTLEKLLQAADIVSLHLPLNKNTKYIIDREEIALMKKNAILINTARGDLVHPNPLAEALLKKSIAGAGIDVFFKEPPIPDDHSLLYAEHALLSPHVGFFTEEALNRRAKNVFDNIKEFMEKM